MRSIFFLVSFLSLVLTSCKKSEPLSSNKDQKALYQQFHGKYNIVSTTASEAIDVNLDGVSSINLKEELPYMDDAGLEIRITERTNAFIEYWPQPYFIGLGGASPKYYDPAIPLTYARQSVDRIFEFSEDLKTILLNQDGSNTNLQLFPRPESVLVKEGNIIEVTKTKEFYTTSGWKKVKVVTLYKRYTMET